MCRYECIAEFPQPGFTYVGAAISDVNKVVHFIRVYLWGALILFYIIPSLLAFRRANKESRRNLKNSKVYLFNFLGIRRFLDAMPRKSRRSLMIHMMISVT